MSGLNWRTLTGSTNPKFLVNGAELSVAFAAGHRFAVYEVRCRDEEGQPDRKYVIRDAQSVSDAQVKKGVRPTVCAETRDYGRLMKWIREQEVA
jgi:hypothetical protein